MKRLLLGLALTMLPAPVMAQDFYRYPDRYRDRDYDRYRDGWEYRGYDRDPYRRDTYRDPWESRSYDRDPYRRDAYRDPREYDGRYYEREDEAFRDYWEDRSYRRDRSYSPYQTYPSSPSRTYAQPVYPERPRGLQVVPGRGIGYQNGNFSIWFGR